MRVVGQSRSSRVGDGGGGELDGVEGVVLGVGIASPAVADDEDTGCDGGRDWHQASAPKTSATSMALPGSRDWIHFTFPSEPMTTVPREATLRSAQ